MHGSQSMTLDSGPRPQRRWMLRAVIVLTGLAILAASRGVAPAEEMSPVADVSNAEFLAIASDALALPTPLNPGSSRPAGRRGTAPAATRAPVAAPVAAGVLAVPTPGTVPECGWFGCPRPGHLHNGLDISAVEGTPVLAAADGVVASVDMPQDSEGYGLFICLQHGPQLATCYAHMSAWVVGVEVGARVARGQPIGLVGSTGHSTGPHLHFEVRRGSADCRGCAVDPYPYFFPAAGRAPA
jgi:murein DD-endopeptidase MepM/ murein hydrolase activator NlpD